MSFLRAVFYVAFMLCASLAHAQHSVKCITPHTTRNPKSPTALDSMPSGFRDSIVSPSGRFIIHYNLTASVADSTTPIEYARRAAVECDSAYDFEIGELGYTAPAFTDGFHYHFYLSPLHRMPQRPYGATYVLEESELEQAPSGTRRFRSWCIIENSFPDSIYATTGYDALRVTIFHEFFHMVQFSGYGDPIFPPARYTYFQEMSSTWMEWRSTPWVKDYLQYAKHYMSNLELRFDLIPGLGIYGQYLYFAYLSNRFGDDVVKQCWERYRDHSSDPMTAIEMTLQSHETQWCSEYEKFGVELLHTGRRFTGVSKLPDAPVLQLDQLAIHRLNIDSSWQFISFGLSMIFAESGQEHDTCSVVIARDTDRMLQSNGTITFSANGSTSVSYDDPEAFCDTTSCVLPSIAGIDAFPNPFVLSAEQKDSVFIYASNRAAAPLSTVLDVYSIKGIHVRHYDMASNSVPVRGTWNAAWNGRDDLDKLVESGEYFYKLKVDGALKIGKILLIRK
jgi:hypothetical protein